MNFNSRELNSRDERVAAFLEKVRPFFFMDERMAIIHTLDKMGFFNAPASRHYHGAYPGGLFDHSYTVMSHLSELTDKLSLKWQAERSPVIIGLLHDLCKCDLYILQEDGSFVYNEAADFRHGIKSAELALKLLPDLTSEEHACIEFHMGAYAGKEAWCSLDSAIQLHPNVLWTHTADMMAAKFDGI